MKRRRRWWILVAVVLVVVLAPLWIILSSRHTMAADLDALRKEGVPITYAELDAMTPKEGANAAPIYQEVAGRLRSGPESGALPTFVKEMMKKGPLSSKAIAALQSLEKLNDLLRTAASMPRCVFNAEARPGSEGDLKSLETVGQCASLPSIMVTVECRDGKPIAALPYIESLMRFSGQTCKEPGSTAFDTSVIMNTEATGACLTCLVAGSHDRNVIVAVLHVLQTAPPPPSIRNLVAGEFPDAMSEYDAAIKNPELQKIKVWGEPPEPPGPILGSPIGMRYAVGQVVHQWRSLLDALSKDTNDVHGAMVALGNANAAAAKQWPSGELFRVPFDSYQSEAMSLLTAIAERRLTEAAAQVMLYRLDHGTLPDSLPASGVDAIDPYNDKPLLYRKLGKSFVLYSVGDDLVYNGVLPTAQGFTMKRDLMLRID